MQPQAVVTAHSGAASRRTCRIAHRAAPLRERRARLRVVKSGVLLEDVDVSGRAITVIGRGGPAADIVHEHPSLSRMHVAVAHEGDAATFLVDLGSTHGTFVGATKLRPWEPLKVWPPPGDHGRGNSAGDGDGVSFTLGGSARVYTLLSAAPATAAARATATAGAAPRPPLQVAFIGLGNMGGPMARNLVAAGHDVKVYDVAADAVTKLTSAGATAADSVEKAVKGVSTVITMLPNTPHVRSVSDLTSSPDRFAAVVRCPDAASQGWPPRSPPPRDTHADL